MRTYSCLCGIYSLYSSVCDRTHTCVAHHAHVLCAAEYATTCPACMPVWKVKQPHVWQIMQPHACLCGRYCSVCMPAWQVMQLHACLCGGLCNCMQACVAHTPSQTECGGLCNRMCGTLCRCMHASVADNAVCACLCGRLCGCMHAYVADTTCVAKNATAFEPLSGSASTPPARAVLCYAVLCLLSLARRGAPVCYHS